MLVYWPPRSWDFLERWQPAVFPMQVMVVAGIFRAISVPGSDMLRANRFQMCHSRLTSLKASCAGAVLLVAARGLRL
jgi:hypothetical protein